MKAIVLTLSLLMTACSTQPVAPQPHFCVTEHGVRDCNPGASHPGIVDGR